MFWQQLQQLQQLKVVVMQQQMYDVIMAPPPKILDHFSIGQSISDAEGPTEQRVMAGVDMIEMI